MISLLLIVALGGAVVYLGVVNVRAIGLVRQLRGRLTLQDELTSARENIISGLREQIGHLNTQTELLTKHNDLLTQYIVVMKEFSKSVWIDGKNVGDTGVFKKPSS